MFTYCYNVYSDTSLQFRILFCTLQRQKKYQVTQKNVLNTCIVQMIFSWEIYINNVIKYYFQIIWSIVPINTYKERMIDLCTDIRPHSINFSHNDSSLKYNAHFVQIPLCKAYKINWRSNRLSIHCIYIFYVYYQYPLWHSK